MTEAGARPTRGGYPILSVSELVHGLRGVLQDVFPTVWVRGEIAGLRPARSGHLYFTIKDERAQLSCVCFRGDALRLVAQPEEGLEALVGGDLEIYPERGQLQIIVRAVEPVGLGALMLAFERLKQKLLAEGLFDDDRKRPIPRLPRGVGVVTSPTGAVIRDIVTVSGRRFPGIPIRVAASRVQGSGAEAEVVAALGRLNAREDIDVIVVARGGGSLEDLMPFNSEVVARAVAASRLPVVSAVGHETDVTLCDLAADLRAATPSAAAELVFPDRAELRRQTVTTLAAVVARMERLVRMRQRDVATLAARLRDPRRELRLRAQRLDDTSERIQRGIHALHAARAAQLAAVAGRIDALSPLRVLGRGYAIVESRAGEPRTRARQTHAGESVVLRFSDGRATARVDTVDLDGTPT